MMEPASLQATVVSADCPGRQDIDEALPKLLLGHARPAGADPTGRTELLKDSPRASDRP
jgi:hypothetical protein